MSEVEYTRSEDQIFRIAAVADLHYGRGKQQQMADMLAEASRASDVLLLCGDLTDHGRPGEARMLLADLHEQVRGPILAVFGNHDLEAEQATELTAVLERGGVQVLDGECASVGPVGFAGAKGFCGGFGKRSVHPFGERELKEFLNVTVNEALKLETALSRLDTEHRVILLHYAPVPATVEGEPPEIFPFLGSSRLEDPINHHGASVVFHGHAHKGSVRGQTQTGVPVYNVSAPLLKHTYPERPPFFLYELALD